MVDPVIEIDLNSSVSSDYINEDLVSIVFLDHHQAYSLKLSALTLRGMILDWIN